MSRRTVRMEFVACDTCRVKPGSPPLCQGCLNNRAVISRLTDGSIVEKKQPKGCTCEEVWFENPNCRVHGR